MMLSVFVGSEGPTRVEIQPEATHHRGVARMKSHLEATWGGNGGWL